MVDTERVLRMLAGIETDIAFLAPYADVDAEELLGDAVALRGIKYTFITAIEGCTRVAHHIGAAEGWPPAETNAAAVQALGEIDDRRALTHLARLGDLRSFATQIARWLEGAPEQGKA